MTSLKTKLYSAFDSLLTKLKLELFYHYSTDPNLLDEIDKLRKKQLMLLTVSEAIQLCECVARCTTIPGGMAEVGVSNGGSALLIAQRKGTNTLHLFDTFEGLPENDAYGTYFKKNQYKASMENTQQLLKKYEQIHWHVGLFPATAEGIIEKFSFVHLDVDLYASTLDALKFFYPKMAQGGIILTHDYRFSAGVRKAFMEFCADKKEAPLALATNQALIVKLS